MSWNTLVVYYYTGNNFFHKFKQICKSRSSAYMKLSRKCGENCEGKKGKENSMESNEQTYAKDPFFLSYPNNPNKAFQWWSAKGAVKD